MPATRSFVSRFSPNRTAPIILERIFVQRHRLAETWLQKLRDSVLTGVKHHLLAVGPRGCGKSHLVSLLVHRLRQDAAVVQRVRIARLPEDETTPSFWKFMLRILRALHAEYGDEFAPFPPQKLNHATDERRGDLLAGYLLEKLAGRTLLVVAENLDDVMRGLKAEGQKRWRAFLQENEVVATLATAQQITEDLSNRDRPFHAFFQVENLQPLTADEALELLRRLAELSDNQELVHYLGTPAGRSRVRAVRHITGGSHRVFIIMSEFVTRRALDDLVMAFEELLDELTPYYQERLRWLPDQQREIVEFLCRQTYTVPVKQIAESLYMSQQTAAAQLKQLKEKGYVTAATTKRESRYQLSEPMMRLCVEVKDPQREPIRLIVEFLRVWYERDELATRLECLAADAEIERRYFQAVIKAQIPGTPGMAEEAFNQDLEAARSSGNADEMVRVLVDLSMTADSGERCVKYAWELSRLDRYIESLAALERAIQLGSSTAYSWGLMAGILSDLDRCQEGLLAAERAIQIDPSHHIGWFAKWYSFGLLGRHEEALSAIEKAIEVGDQVTRYLAGKGITLNSLGRYEEGIAAFDQIIAIDPNASLLWQNRGLSNLMLRRYEEAITDFQHAVALEHNDVDTIERLAEVYILTGNWLEAEKQLFHRFQLFGHSTKGANLRPLVRCITAAFRATSESGVWAANINRLAACAAAALEERTRKGISPSPTDVPPDDFVWANPFTLLAVALIGSLADPVYDHAPAGMLPAWVKAWHEAAEKFPDISFGVRLFDIGIRYKQTKDSRVLLDLVQEERDILAKIFDLDEETDTTMNQEQIIPDCVSNNYHPQPRLPQKG